MSDPLKSWPCPVCGTVIADHENMIWIVRGAVVCSEGCARKNANDRV